MASNRPQDLLEPGTASADINPPPPLPETKTVTTLLTEDIGFIRHQVRYLHEATGALHQRSHDADWDARTTARSRMSAKETLAELAILGFGWRHVARLARIHR